MTADVIVVGSGPAGANAAAALVERGRRVLMLDVGDTDATYEALVPAQRFALIREWDAGQHRYFLGERFEGIPDTGVRVGAQLTPPRTYVTASAARLTPSQSTTFTAAESLALGGLGNAWGAGVFEFDSAELADWPVSITELRPHYDAVAARIGVSGATDDLSRFFPQPAHAMPPLEIDSSADQILRAYQAKRESFNAEGLFLGRPGMAVSTEALGDRGPHEYRDMDFWADTDRSVYRPRWTIAELRRSNAFEYVGRQLVLRFAEHADGTVTVTTRDVDAGASRRFSARVLLLGAGTLGTSRIVLRSLDRFGQRVPLLCNPYTYAPVINWRMLGGEARDRRHSLAQLTAIHQPRAERGSRGSVQAQLFSYRSLLNFRLLRELPLAQRDGLRALRVLLPALGILGISHDDSVTSEKYCELRAGGGGDGCLEISYRLTGIETSRNDAGERAMLGFFRRLGAWPIKRVHPGHGSSIHYAGTFPMRHAPRDLETGADGRLAGTRAVHLVDGSTFPYLPAKGLTFTIMANANRIADLVARRLA
ncbi:MAG TPA: GMC oxidoreductase [Gemmatimonadaceae bacterium]|nr:GMC oxidoreductase [Gemmatimonadaceae bacterium]